MSRVYVFVRQDIPVVHQMVQSNHATQQMFERFGRSGDRILHIPPFEDNDPDSIPKLILIGVPNEESLKDVAKHLDRNRVYHYLYHEPPECGSISGYTALTTIPVDDTLKFVFAQYERWEKKNNIPSER